MRRPDFLGSIEGSLRRLESAPQVVRALDQMDHCIGYMARADYASSNPALNAVRAPLAVSLWVIAGLALVVVIWGMLAPIESAVQAHGKIVLAASRKTIQHLEGGIIENILVKDGDRVTAGQKLVQLKDTAPNANRDSLQHQVDTERASMARLEAERDNGGGPVFDEDMVTRSKDDAGLDDILATQRHLFDAERAGQEAKLAELDRHAGQAREEINGLEAQKQSAMEQIDLLGKEIDSVKDLLAQGYATETRLLALQRNQSELTGSRGQYEAQIAKANQAIEETGKETDSQKKEFEAKTLQAIHDAQVKVTDLQDKLHAAEDVEGRTIIKAPTEGIVTGLRFHTPGGVIAPGTAVMDLVPQSDKLIVEIRVKPTDIATVHPGMDARIVFTAYKMRTTPKIPGKVTEVSADVFTDDHANPPSSYYTAQVEVDDAFLKSLAQPVELYPGMPAEVMVRTGKRSFLAYLFRPIVDSMDKAFREQ